MPEHVAIWIWVISDVIPATDAAGDAAIWLGLILTGIAILAAGRRIITGPLATEQQQMKHELTELTKAVSHLAGMQGSHSGINAIAPRLAGTIGSQTDLPSSVAVGTIGNTAIRQFFWLKP